MFDIKRIPIKIHATYTFKKDNSRDPGIRSQARNVSSSENIYTSYEPIKPPTESVPALLHRGKGSGV